MLTGESYYRELAYRKAAWSIDEMDSNIQDLYEDHGINGLKTIKNVDFIPFQPQDLRCR